MTKHEFVLLLVWGALFFVGGMAVGYNHNAPDEDVRTQCAKEATPQEASYSLTHKLAVKQMNNKYRLCLVKHGEKPESLFVN